MEIASLVMITYCVGAPLPFYYMAGCLYYKLMLILFVFPPAEVPVDKLSVMPALKVLNVQSNPLDSNSRSALQSAHHFDTLSSPES